MMFHAYRHITNVAHAERIEPLNHEEQQNLTRTSMCCISTRVGSWKISRGACSMKTSEGNAFSQPKHRWVSRRNICEQCPWLVEIASELEAHTDWNKSLKRRRDPVAHRSHLHVFRRSASATRIARSILSYRCHKAAAVRAMRRTIGRQRQWSQCRRADCSASCVTCGWATTQPNAIDDARRAYSGSAKLIDGHL